MNNIRARSWLKLSFYNPKGVLIELQKQSLIVSQANVPYSVSSLRTNQLNKYRQGRQCALFCYGMSQKLGVDVRFAFAEEQDIDFVACYEINDTINLVPLQMKELVPEQVNDSALLQNEINKLSKHVDSHDLVVAFHINRNVRISPDQLDLSRVKVGQIWIMECSGNENEWIIVGNLLDEIASTTKFQYPES